MLLARGTTFQCLAVVNVCTPSCELDLPQDADQIIDTSHTVNLCLEWLTLTQWGQEGQLLLITRPDTQPELSGL